MSQDPNKVKPARRRESFDAVAKLYGRYRPPYPPEVIDSVVALSRLHSGSSVLEIGCGTGQLSLPLAKLGARLVAVELGPHLAALATQHLQQFPNARVEVSSFEDWPLPSQRFDAVVSASAFHWLDPTIRFSKSAEALRSGGYLTILHVHHVQGGTPGFIAATQPYYIKWRLSEDPWFQPTTPDDAPVIYPELDHLPEFRAVERRRFEIPASYSTNAYVGMLQLDSLVNGLDGESRRGFLQDIERLIDSRYGGVVVRNYVYEIVAAQKAS
jgi:SAM-dependent methyltransferase